MARNPTIRVPIAGQRYPRLTQNGQLLNNQEIGKNIDNWITSAFEEELRLTAFLDVNTRRQIRLATGVGDMEAYVSNLTTDLPKPRSYQPINPSRVKMLLGKPGTIAR